MIKPCILVIDDRPDIRLSASFVLEDNGYSVLEADSPYLAKELITNNKVDLILLDMNYSLDTTSGEEGLELLSWIKKSELGIPAVAMTAWSNVALAVKAMQLGAGDFIEKPWKNQRLLQIIAHQLSLNGLKVQNQKLQQRLEPASQFEYVWRSSCMQQLMSQIEHIATTDVAILLTGDNGTGKSQLARFIHERSHRKSGPFIAVNMGAISESLFESEMFGHKKGAFTDAKASRIGRFELAKQGTLFLDEIANIPMSQQAKLLRVVESGEYEMLGSSVTEKTNIRLISASNGNFENLIATDRFREDLFYRLNTLEFRVPSLKERVDDIVPLAQYFISHYANKYQKPQPELSQCAQQALLMYHWPGNIRELSHLMERAVLLYQLPNGNNQTACDIKLYAKDLLLSPNRNTQTLPLMTLEQAEIKLIKQALVVAKESIPQAAKLLGLTKSSLYRRLEKYENEFAKK